MMINHQIFGYHIVHLSRPNASVCLVLFSKVTIPLTKYLMVSQTIQTKLTTRFVLPLTLYNHYSHYSLGVHFFLLFITHPFSLTNDLTWWFFFMVPWVHEQKKSFGSFKKNQPSTRNIIPLKTINKPLINHHLPVVIPLNIFFCHIVKKLSHQSSHYIPLTNNNPIK